ncbi:MAG: GNAT family N-acetyltransferase [Clostridiales bacterium]|nr:GNAT family N-acetyltransferase [Clostridiales bacterium]
MQTTFGREMNSLQLYRAVGTLTRAFRDDPLPRLIAPDPAHRTPMMRAVFAYNIRCAREAGGVIVSSPRFEGVAVWMRSESSPSAPERELRRIPAGALARLIEMSRALDEARLDAADGKEHIYLSALGVLPGFRGRGIATALLNTVKSEAARENRAVYLETVAPSNLAYYEKRGFAVVSEISLEGTRCFLMRTQSPA